MADTSSDDKTEKPTPKKRSEARSKGDVAKSMEVPSVAVIIAGLMTLAIFWSHVYGFIQMIMKESFSLITLRDLSLPFTMEFAGNTITSFIMAIVPLMAAVFITAILSNIMQVGFLLSSESIKPKFSKLNPIKGLGKLFSKQSFMELFKSLMKLAIVGGVAYLTVKGEMKNILVLGEMEPNAIFAYILITIFKLFILCILSMIPLVIIDYVYKRWEYENKLKMSKQEVKDEHKRTEGDPKVKSRIRSIQMEMARKRIMQAVPEADVVITNPTHLAVALKYESSVMKAPKLIAKGARRIAQKIKELAEKHDIPIVENKKLAQSLYTLVEIDQEIPPSLYQAVAEVLAFIYKLKGNDAYGGVRS